MAILSWWTVLKRHLNISRGTRQLSESHTLKDGRGGVKEWRQIFPNFKTRQHNGSRFKFEFMAKKKSKIIKKGGFYCKTFKKNLNYKKALEQAKNLHTYKNLPKKFIIIIYNYSIKIISNFVSRTLTNLISSNILEIKNILNHT